MKELTFFEKYFYFPLRDFISSIEYHFAKKWLNDMFGEELGKQEYWGEVIMDLISKSRK